MLSGLLLVLVVFLDLLVFLVFLVLLVLLDVIVRQCAGVLLRHPFTLLFN